MSKAYNAIVEAQGPHFPDAQAVIADAYASKQFDEFILPAVVGDYHGMRDGDGVLCFNFRADRCAKFSAPCWSRISPALRARAPFGS